MSVKPSFSSGTRLIVGLAILATALLLKIFYSGAESEELIWIVGPIASLLELFTDFSFVREPGFGWIDFNYNIVIAPSCAGVNFLIIAFCMSSFLVLGRDRSMIRMISNIAIVGFASYLITTVACTARIFLSVHVYSLDIYSGWLTPEVIHRAVGVCVYYLFLIFYFHLVYSLCPDKNQAREKTDGPAVSIRKWFVFLTPLFWYLTFSLGVPFLNGAYGADSKPFLWHALTVGGVSVLLTILVSTLTALKNGGGRSRTM